MQPIPPELIRTAAVFGIAVAILAAITLVKFLKDRRNQYPQILFPADFSGRRIRNLKSMVKH